MKLKTMKHVEDYLEYLGGYEATGTKSVLRPNVSTNINLARYDINIVDNMAASTVWGTSLTDKQSELAVKLILKYRKQFAKNGFDVSTVENPQFRLPVRKVDRSKTVKIVDDYIELRFPYDTKMINQLQEFRGTSQGSAKFERSEKVWKFGITEHNVSWLLPWAEGCGFDVDAKIHEMLEKIVDCENEPYKLELVKQDDGYTVTNAPSTLLGYLTHTVGTDIVKLIDHSGVCGYSVDQEIMDQAEQEYGPSLKQIATQHSVHITPSPSNLDMIFDYAEITNRYPICVYNPTLFDIDLSRFKEKDIVRFDRNGKTKTSEYNPYDVKIIYARKIPATWNFPVPLLVTTFEMMFGGRKMDWTRKAEKVIYYGATQIRDQY